MTLHEIRLDRTTISPQLLNIETKTRSNLFPWNGQFSPQLAHVLLDTYGSAKDLVVDPFAGSGTVLVEAGRCGLRAFGAEINPAAFSMAQTYRFINCPDSARLSILRWMNERIEQAFPIHFALDPRSVAPSPCEVRARLVGLHKNVRHPGCRKLLESLIIITDFYRRDLTAESVLSSWQRLSSTVRSLPYSPQPIELELSDARELPLTDQSVDLVITSPPYINVFNYHQQFRASAEALGWDLLEVAKSEIGSNRKNRGNRFLTVIQYCLEVAEALRELRRVCRPGARIIMVVGRESSVRKTPFFNGDIVTRIGVCVVGMIAEKRQERAFTNRYGEKIYEDIIHFRPGPEFGGVTLSASSVAEEALRAWYERAPVVSKSDIEDALSRVSTIRPSPVFRRQNAQRRA